jgi:hypothetical protein
VKLLVPALVGLLITGCTVDPRYPSLSSEDREGLLWKSDRPASIGDWGRAVHPELAWMPIITRQESERLDDEYYRYVATFLDVKRIELERQRLELLEKSMDRED